MPQRRLSPTPHLADMSLYVDDDRRQGRSRSRSRDRRPKDEPERDAPHYGDVREPSYVYPEDDLDGRYKPSRRGEGPPGGGLPYPAEGGMDSMLPGDQGLYNYDDHRPSYRTASPPPESQYRSSRDSQLPGTFPEDDKKRHEDRPSRREDDRRDEKPSRRDDDRRGEGKPSRRDDDRRGDDRSRRDDGRTRRDEDRYRRDDDDDRRVRYADPEDRRNGKSRRGDDEEKRDSGSRRDVDEDKLKHLPMKYSRTYSDTPESPRHSRNEKPSIDDDRLRFLPQKYGRKYEDHDEGRGSDREKDRKAAKKERLEEDLAYGKPSPMSPRDAPPTYGSYIPPSPVDEKRSARFSTRDESPSRRRPASPSADYGSSRNERDPYRDDPRGSRADVLTVEPGSRRRDKSPGPSMLTADPEGRDADRSRDRKRDKSPGPSVLTVEPGSRDRDRSRDRRSSGRDRSPQPPTARMSSLTVDTGRSSTASLSLAAAPGSPLLESYHGTYQACSPMPSPLLIASGNPSELEPLSPLASGDEGDGGKKRNRRARFHDPEDIASQLARALRGDGPPDTRPLIDILPSLTHDQVMELRSEYKRLVKTGSARKGVNIAKHVRARLKDEDPSLMKACYSVALGMWEAEAYWANFWYQGDKTRRELLIESLMGRSNHEIRLIKDAFTDKKYDNSLTKCMKTELKEDKFKKAVLMVLEERRMEDRDPSGRSLPLDYKLVDQDVDDLHRSVKADKGGESLMISIVVQRSDTHLRAVLKDYERAFRSNFARDALKKSGNLVVSLQTC